MGTGQAQFPYIAGLGSDLIDIRRIQRVLDRYGARFINRCFTPLEQEKCERRRARAESYARRWAAKEACAKALGTGFRRSVFQKDLGVVNLKGGKPTMALTGGALRRLQEMTPPGMRAQIDLTMTDEPPIAEAVVIISMLPAEDDADGDVANGRAGNQD